MDAASFRLLQQLTTTGFVSMTRTSFRECTGVAATQTNIGRILARLSWIGVCVDLVSAHSAPMIAFAVGRSATIPECPAAYLHPPGVAANDPV